MTTQKTSDYAAFAFRVASGSLFLAHGWLKISDFTIAGTVGHSAARSPTKGSHHADT